MNQQIKTGLGTAIILIFAITAVYFVKMAENQAEIAQPVINNQLVSQNNSSQIANPASVFCKDRGGSLEIRTGEDGGQTGYCKFPDGSECEEWAYFRGECQSGNSNFSQNVIDLCNEDRNNWKNCKPDSSCMDGFNSNCYFDSSLYKKDSLKAGMDFHEETRKACFAIHSTSACQCGNKFELKENGEFREVSCEEFFQAIKDKNNTCNKCVDKIWAGCC